jgi:hypothetical protein
MNTIDNIKEQYQQLQSANGSSALTSIEQNAFNTFSKMGIPTVRHEEWKYTVSAVCSIRIRICAGTDHYQFYFSRPGTFPPAGL